MTIYNFDVLLSQFWTSPCSMSGSNCCFLSCIQVSQEASKVVYYSQLLKNFPVCCDPHSQSQWSISGCFSIVNEAEVVVFLEFPCFFCDPEDVGNLMSDSFVFSKSSLYICKFSVHRLLTPSLITLYLLSVSFKFFDLCSKKGYIQIWHRKFVILDMDSDAKLDLSIYFWGQGCWAYSV